MNYLKIKKELHQIELLLGSDLSKYKGDYLKQKKAYIEKSFKKSKDNLTVELKQLKTDYLIYSKLLELNFEDKEKSKTVVKEVLNLIPKSNSKIKVNVPLEIKEEILSDLNEAKINISSSSYRSAIILCGRALEVALHRKYYDVTKNDLLETSPNIGLGKLIAKLKEKNIFDDSGITQQIHLINNVRISSVHKKQTFVKPTYEQANAIFLYTLDILNKLYYQV